MLPNSLGNERLSAEQFSMGADLRMVLSSKQIAKRLLACMQEYDLNAAEYHTAPLDTQRTRQVLEAIQLTPTQLDGYAEVTIMWLPDDTQYSSQHMLHPGIQTSNCALTACAQQW